MKKQGLIATALSVILCVTALGETHYVDLSGAANRSLEDDGVAGNGQGGWSDEGANDMFIFPPLQFGEVERNAHHFFLLRPTVTKPQTIIMLRSQALKELPEQVEVPVPNVRGRYVYFLQTLVRTPRNARNNIKVAQYTVHYDDGSERQIDLIAGQHLRHWWTGNWWDNDGANSWPIFMGRNAYSNKWRQMIGVWAMQWPNPDPDKPITAITLASTGLASPAIFAITIDDADYHANARIKADFKRPADVPASYFDNKLAIEREHARQEMVRLKMIQGIRELELIRPDLLAITIDAWASGGPGRGEAKAAALQSPERFAIRIHGGSTTHPLRVGRKSYEFWNGDIGPIKQDVVYWHTYYLQLSQPLPVDSQCTVKVSGMEDHFNNKATITFDPHTLVTRVIKINQVAYAENAKRRYAYLGWWAAELGAVNYDQFPSFDIVDDQNGRTVLSGPIALRAKDDPLSGERVYEMDLSQLKRGQYHIVIDGLGRSSRFEVGGDGIDELYRQTNRAYYHQRAGAKLTEPYTTFTTDLHHHRLTRSGRVVADGENVDEPTKTFRGGYHDAADFDVFTYHLRATGQTLAAYEMHPKAYADGDLNIPESGNGIPDVLDEANWALLGYLELQQENGAVPLGRGNAQDAQRDYVRQHGEAPPFGIFPPTTNSSAEYAAVAAQYARLIQPFDAERAATFVASARKAFAWAQANPNRGDRAERGGKLIRVWAAAELFCTTGDPEIQKQFKTLYKDGSYTRAHWSYGQYLPSMMQSYAMTERQDADRDIQSAMRDRLIQIANRILKKTDAPAYRVGFGAKDRGMGWGNLNGGGRYAVPLLIAYHITNDQHYLDAASLNADFQLGCNPLSKTFITGMGVRPPLHPQIAAYLYTGPDKTGSTVKGITIYGLASRDLDWHPDTLPPWRRWRDLGNGGAEISSEFTITETIGASSMLYGTLRALQQ